MRWYLGYDFCKYGWLDIRMASGVQERNYFRGLEGNKTHQTAIEQCK